MLRYFAAVIPILMYSHQAWGICAGFELGIGNQIILGGGTSRWNVYDDSCNVIDGLTTVENPCTQGIFGCSPAPIFFEAYMNSFTGQHFKCFRDSSAESCGSDPVSVCCSPA